MRQRYNYILFLTLSKPIQPSIQINYFHLQLTFSLHLIPTLYLQCLPFFQFNHCYLQYIPSIYLNHSYFQHIPSIHLNHYYLQYIYFIHFITTTSSIFPLFSFRTTTFNIHSLHSANTITSNIFPQFSASTIYLQYNPYITSNMFPPFTYNLQDLTPFSPSCTPSVWLNIDLHIFSYFCVHLILSLSPSSIPRVQESLLGLEKRYISRFICIL